MATKKQVTEIVEAILNTNMTAFTWDQGAAVHELVDIALDMYEDEREDRAVYRAMVPKGPYTNKIFGYFTGNTQDIAAFVDHEKVEVKKLDIKHIASGYANHKKNIVAKRDKLLAEVARLNKALKEKNFHREEA